MWRKIKCFFGFHIKGIHYSIFDSDGNCEQSGTQCKYCGKRIRGRKWKVSLKRRIKCFFGFHNWSDGVIERINGNNYIWCKYCGKKRKILKKGYNIK